MDKFEELFKIRAYLEEMRKDTDFQNYINIMDYAPKNKDQLQQLKAKKKRTYRQKQANEDWNQAHGEHEDKADTMSHYQESMYVE